MTRSPSIYGVLGVSQNTFFLVAYIGNGFICCSLGLPLNVKTHLAFHVIIIFAVPNRDITLYN